MIMQIQFVWFAPGVHNSWITFECEDCNFLPIRKKSIDHPLTELLLWFQSFTKRFLFFIRKELFQSKWEEWGKRVSLSEEVLLLSRALEFQCWKEPSLCIFPYESSAILTSFSYQLLGLCSHRSLCLSCLSLHILPGEHAPSFSD